MKFLFTILLIALLSAVAEYVLPWWSMAAVCFIVALLVPQKKVHALFWSGFFGVALFWLVVALWYDVRNEQILSSRMAVLFHLPGSWLFILASVLIGGVVGGLSSLSGAMVKPVRKS